MSIFAADIQMPNEYEEIIAVYDHRTYAAAHIEL